MCFEKLINSSEEREDKVSSKTNLTDKFETNYLIKTSARRDRNGREKTRIKTKKLFVFLEIQKKNSNLTPWPVYPVSEDRRSS